MHDRNTLPNRIAKAVDQRLAKLFAQNDSLSLIYERCSLALSPGVRRQPLVLFQMGRVGSRTLEDSLTGRLNGVRVHHVHFLTEDGQANFNRLYIGNPHFKGSGLRYVVRNRFLAQQIRSTLHKETWQVVTAVRDPIARNISMFFTMLLARWPETNARERFHAGDSDALLREIIPLFMNEFDHNSALKWFDEEMKAVFDFDVYSEPFNKVKGYHIYEQDNTRVLLVRLENLNESGVEAFRTFLNLPEFTIRKTNVAANKDYGPLYQRFVEEIDLPDSYIERMYNSRFARHFYTDSELIGFRERWVRNRKPHL